MCIVCCWIQKSVENILSEFLFKICLQSIIYGWFRHQKQINASFSCWRNRSVIEQSAAFHLWVVSVHSKHDTWHMTHEPWAVATTWAKRLLIPTSRLGAYSRTSQLIHWGWYVSGAWGVIIYSAGICECWPTYQWTNASASVCNEAVLCYKTFPCSKYFLFYSITDIFDNKINNLALWYINFIAQHFSVRLRTSGMWAIAIVKNNNHKSMQHYCINFEVVQFFHSKCLRS